MQEQVGILDPNWKNMATNKVVCCNKLCSSTYLDSMLESFPSGRLQLAPFTGSHQGAAAT